MSIEPRQLPSRLTENGKMHAMMGEIGAFYPKSVNGKLFGVFVFWREIGFGGGVMGLWVDECRTSRSFMTKSQISKSERCYATSVCVDPC